jgi:NADH-quinone oxidoreductase subunit C
MKDLVQELQQELAERFGTALPVEPADFSRQGTHLAIAAEPSQIEALAAAMDRLGCTLEAISGVDWPTEGLLEAVYDFNRALFGGRVTVRVRVPRDRPEIPTISGVFGGADWHEREAHDLFGIVFAGHRNLTPLLLPEDAVFHPLRKDFSA